MSQNFGYCQTNVQDTQQFPKELSLGKWFNKIRKKLDIFFMKDHLKFWLSNSFEFPDRSLLEGREN